MAEKPARYKVRTKLWLHDEEGNVIFGMGRTKMLEAIERCGSISAAAKELKMSYRAVWARISPIQAISLHHRIFRSSTAFRGNPLYILIWIFNITCLTVNTV